jgi:hypothetical protein
MMEGGLKPGDLIQLNKNVFGGDLVQIRKHVTGAGDIGIVIGPATGPVWDNYGGCLDVLFHEGIRHVHPSNIQAPDGRTKPRR